MVDPRIKKLQEAALALQEGHFELEFPTEPPDEVGKLAEALHRLALRIEQRFKQLRSLAQVTEQINAGLFLDEVLTSVYDTFKQLLPYERIGFSLIDEARQTVTATWARSESPTISLNTGYTAPLAGSSLQTIIDTGQPRIINDLQAYLRDHPQSGSTALIVEEGMRASLTCPLIAMGQPIGFMFFSSMTVDAYQDEHVELIRQIAGQLAIIVEKSRLYERLIQLNEEKNTLLGMAAHDLRGPLTVIRGFLELLQGGFTGSEELSAQEVYSLLRRASDNMLNIIDNFLDVSAIEAGRLVLNHVQVDLEALLRETHLANGLLARGKGIALELELPEALPTVVVDPHRLQQILTNLISNAIKFSRPGGTIGLGASVGRDHLEVWVSDSGQGIPEAELPLLFKPYRRGTTRPTQGERSTGLGLAIVKRMVEAHGGTLRVHSEQGVGTTVTICLPVCPSKAADSRCSQRASEAVGASEVASVTTTAGAAQPLSSSSSPAGTEEHNG